MDLAPFVPKSSPVEGCQHHRVPTWIRSSVSVHQPPLLSVAVVTPFGYSVPPAQAPPVLAEVHRPLLCRAALAVPGQALQRDEFAVREAVHCLRAALQGIGPASEKSFDDLRGIRGVPITTGGE